MTSKEKKPDKPKKKTPKEKIPKSKTNRLHVIREAEDINQQSD